MKNNTLSLNKATQRMVIDDILVAKAQEQHQYFSDLILASQNAHDTETMAKLGFTANGKAQLIPEMKLKLEEAKMYNELRKTYAGYLIVPSKHLLAWMMVNNLYIGNQYQYTGLIPDQNAEDIRIFNEHILSLDHVRIEYKDGGKWIAVTNEQRQKFAKRFQDVRGKGLHTIDGVRMKFKGNEFGSYMTEANFRALPPYQMIADYNLFDKTQEMIDNAQDSIHHFPNPDPLVLLPVGNFRVVVTAWGHEEKLLPELADIIGKNI